MDTVVIEIFLPLEIKLHFFSGMLICSLQHLLLLLHILRCWHRDWSGDPNIMSTGSRACRPEEWRMSCYWVDAGIVG